MNFEIPDIVKEQYISLIKREKCDYDLLLRYCFYVITYEKDENLLSFVYEIIIEYTLATKDYDPINEISIILGFAPILDILKKKGYKNNNIFENIMTEFYLNDNKYKDKILSSGQKIIYRLINSNEDYSIVAPTSYGKTDLMMDSALKSDGDVIIIVPLVALLNQVKNDMIMVAKKSNINVKVITHHDIKASEKVKNIYVLTQERCYQLIKNNKCKNIKQLYIDESHNLLNNTNRSLKLSEVIYLLKKENNLIVRYYSPVINNPESIIIKGLYKEKIKTTSKIRDLKVYRYYIYNNGFQKLYIPGTNVMTEKYNFKRYNNEIEYIIKNSKNKNIIFLNSPKEIEEFSLKLANNIKECNDKGIKELSEFIGEKYYILDILKKGVIYIHSQMPEVIRQYLIELYRKEKNIKYIVTNSSVLEGINTPSDNLFIINYMIGSRIMKPIEFINLKGRINRISEIINRKNLSQLICNVHFLADTDYKRKKIIKEIINPCYIGMHDEIENPYLEKFVGNIKESDTFIESLKRINLIDDKIDVTNTFNVKLPKEENKIKKICLTNDVSITKEQEHLIENKLIQYYNKNINNTYDLIKCISDVFNLKADNDAAINRLSNEKAEKFYGMLYEWLINSETIKEKANKIYGYYKNTKDELIYIGNGKLIEKNWSSILKNKDGQPIRLKKVWIKNNKTDKELYNLAIVKIKIEEDFISFNLTPYVDVLYQIDKNIIAQELYNLIKYKTDNEFEVNLMQEGMSVYLAKLLNKEKYKKYINFNEEGLYIDKRIMDIFDENEILKYELTLFMECY